MIPICKSQIVLAVKINLKKKNPANLSAFTLVINDYRPDWIAHCRLAKNEELLQPAQS